MPGDEYWILGPDELGGIFESDPDYVFSRAKQLWLEGKSDSSDPLIDMVLAYLKEIRDTRGSDKEAWVVGKQFTNLRRAHILFQHPTLRVKVLIECGILGRATSQELADFLAIDIRVVETYEEVFFNVRDKLDNPGYVLTRVIPAGITQLDHDSKRDGLDEIDFSDADTLRKFSYMEGWDECKRLLASPEFSDKARRHFWGEFEKSEFIKAIRASRIEKVGGKSVTEIVKRRSQGGEKEREMRESLEEQRWLDELSELNRGFKFRAVQPDEAALGPSEQCRLYLNAGEKTDETAG